LNVFKCISTDRLIASLTLFNEEDGFAKERGEPPIVIGWYLKLKLDNQKSLKFKS